MIRKTLFLLFFSFFLIFFSLKRTDGFTLAKITAKDLKPSFLASQISPELKRIFNQEFKYLGRGRQCFVFESSDKNYVIKFINHDRFRFFWPLRAFKFPNSMLQINRIKKEERRKFFLNSFCLAYEKMKEESALVGIHLKETTNYPRLKICTKSSARHLLDLNCYYFVVQKKTDAFLNKFPKSSKEEKKQKLEAILNLLEIRILKNIADDDMDIPINYGFNENQAIVFDTGRFYCSNFEKADAYNVELVKSVKHLRKYLLKNDKDLVSFFEEALERKKH